jgi:hypothetical protein
MNQLGTEARALLARARHSNDPSASDRWAVRRGVAKQVVRVGAASAALTASITTTKASATIASGLKLTLLSQFGLATVAGATLASSAMFVHTSVVRTHADPPAVTGQTPPPSSTLRASPTARVKVVPELRRTAEGASMETDAYGSESLPEVNSESISGSSRVIDDRTSTRKTVPTANRQSPSQVVTPTHETREARQQGVITAPAALREEGRALAEVQNALSEHRGAEALRLLEVQGRSFASGALVQERAAARIFALCELGRRGEARVAAEGFAQTWPDSPLIGRVVATCK